MRLIDADTLKEIIGECPENWTDSPEEVVAFNMWHRIMDDIDSTPTVGDCISVKDRLPDGEDCYLAYNRYGWDIMAYDANEGVWLSMGHRVADGEITHWMPLPEPPKEVQE